MNIASERRDKVDRFKKIFLYIKLALMGVFSLAGSALFVWYAYIENFSKYAARGFTPSFSDGANTSAVTLLGYVNQNILLTISMFICGFIAVGFLTFLVLHGIQTICVNFMMRKANTGK